MVARAAVAGSTRLAVQPFSWWGTRFVEGQETACKAKVRDPKRPERGCLEQAAGSKVCPRESPHWGGETRKVVTMLPGAVPVQVRLSCRQGYEVWPFHDLNTRLTVEVSHKQTARRMPKVPEMTNQWSSREEKEVLGSETQNRQWSRENGRGRKVKKGQQKWTRMELFPLPPPLPLFSVPHPPLPSTPTASSTHGIFSQLAAPPVIQLAFSCLLLLRMRVCVRC